MAITSTGLDAATYVDYTEAPTVEDKTSLTNDDFMMLLLAQLQNQDPTEPTDTEQILTQTSQLAALEATDKTNKALEDLAASLTAANDFSTVAAIGKTADMGSDAIAHEKGTTSSFEVYFPSDVEQGIVNITDLDGNAVATIDMGTNPAGVYQFDWDGLTASGASAEDGIYRVNADYTTPTGESLSTRLGAYPIESVRFENGTTLLKVGSSYVPLENVVEIY